jgi:glycerol uptake facilitator protein
MKPFAAEVIGTALLIILGDGVVAGVVLNKTKAQNSGWMVITTGWAMGVAVAVYAVGRISGAHLNPAITIALAVVGKFSWSDVPRYVGAQFIGAFLGRSSYGWPIWRTGPKLKAKLQSSPSSRPSPPSVDTL